MPTIASSLHQLGRIELERGNLDEAEKYSGESLKLFEKRGDKSGIISSVEQLNKIHEKRG